jgi:hypothetical protein
MLFEDLVEGNRRLFGMEEVAVGPDLHAHSAKLPAAGYTVVNIQHAIDR